jgi:hypothetical protein
MRKLVTLLLFLSAWAQAVQLIGTVRMGGRPFNGTITLQSTYPLTSGGTLNVNQAYVFKIRNGVPEAGANVVGNDISVPQGTLYYADYKDSYGQSVLTGYYYISGTPTFDLGAAIPTPFTTTNIYFQNLVGFQSLNHLVFVDTFTNSTVGAKFDAACSSLNAVNGLLIANNGLGSGWSLNGLAMNCPVLDLRGIEGPNVDPHFKPMISLYGRGTSVGAGLQIPSMLQVSYNPRAGGVNSGVTKTQWQNLRLEMIANTIGERKALEASTNCFGTGDCVGLMGIANDHGGYGSAQTGGEGAIGVRSQACQGDCSTFTDNYVAATISAVAGNNLTLNVTHGGTMSNLGANVPLIITNRATYTTGTISASTPGTPCTITGAGTAWAATYGSGAHNNLYLDITSNNNGLNKLLWPITSITDDTHLVIEYHLSETGDVCLGTGVNHTGGYTIYTGSRISDLATVDTNGVPSYATVVPMTTNSFLVGDSLEQHLGYNFRGTGTTAVVGRSFGEIQGGGFYAVNANTPNLLFAFRASGNFNSGLAFDTGTLAEGIQFSNPVTDAFLRSNDITAADQRIFNVLTSGGTQRYWDYDRTNDWWHTVGGLYMDGGTTRLATNSTIQPNVQFYMGYGNSAYEGLRIAPTFVPGAGKSMLSTEVSGFSQFRQENLLSLFGQGDVLKGYSDNFTTLKWSISSATGTGTFQTMNSVGGSFTGLLNTAGIIASGNIQASNAVITGTSSNTDLAGAISLVAATSASYTFTGSWATAPRCTASPLADLGGAHWWITTSTTTLTVNVSSASTIDFSYICHPRT